MSRIRLHLKRLRRDECGASAVEFSIVVVLFVVMSMGVLELGRAYQVRNELAYAADIGARELSIIVNNPNISSTDYSSRVETVIRNRFTGYSGSTLSVTVTPETIGSVDYQKLTLQYPMTMFIPTQNGTWNLQVTRRAVQL